MIKYENGKLAIGGSIVDIVGDWLALSALIFEDENSNNDPHIKGIREAAAILLGRHYDELIAMLKEAFEEVEDYNGVTNTT